MSKLKCIKYIRDRLPAPDGSQLTLKDTKDFVEGMFAYAFEGKAIHDSETVERIVSEVRYEGFREGYSAGWKDRGNE